MTFGSIEARPRAAARRSGPAGFLVALAVLATLAAGSAAATDRPAPPLETGQSASPAAKAPHEPRRRMSKFEARKIRQACRGRADERNLAGAERDAFLSRCYFSRLAVRVERQQCRQQAAARGLADRAARDFVRQCVRDRLRQKEDASAPHNQH
jgi:hypothetical protein